MRKRLAVHAADQVIQAGQRAAEHAAARGFDEQDRDHRRLAIGVARARRRPPLEQIVAAARALASCRRVDAVREPAVRCGARAAKLRRSASSSGTRGVQPSSSLRPAGDERRAAQRALDLMPGDRRATAEQSRQPLRRRSRPARSNASGTIDRHPGRTAEPGDTGARSRPAARARRRWCRRGRAPRRCAAASTIASATLST